MDTLTVLKVIALSLLTVAAVFVMLAAATMWRAERTASKRINGLISTNPVEPNEGANHTTTAMQDIAEITNLDGKEKQTPPQEGNGVPFSDGEPSTDSDENPPAPSASDQEPAQPTDQDSEGTCNSNLEQRVTRIEETLGAIQQRADFLAARHAGVAVPVASVPKYVMQSWNEDLENLRQALAQYQQREDTEKKESRHDEYTEDSTLAFLRAITLASSASPRPLLNQLRQGGLSTTKYPPFKGTPSSREWKRRGGLDLDRRMDMLCASDNYSVWKARFNLNTVRSLNSIPPRTMDGVRKAVAEAEKSAEKEN